MSTSGDIVNVGPGQQLGTTRDGDRGPQGDGEPGSPTGTTEGLASGQIGKGLGEVAVGAQAFAVH
jgi:hypothetical protein